MEAMHRRPEITQNELALMIGKTTKTVGRKLAQLKENGYIERIVSDRKGNWNVFR